MILVTGTKRSGTSMWMQALGAAGFPLFGEAFPRNWEETLRDANPAGFYESMLRRGIYWETNPHPVSGAYIFPEQATWHAVKVFIPGVIRSDRAYVKNVIATMRPWREYVASLARLESIEAEAIEAEAADDAPARPRPPAMPAELEWWTENYCLVRDVVTRRYPFHYVSYESVLRDPESRMNEVVRWLGKGDAVAAAASIDKTLRTTEAPEPEHGLSAEHVEVFDELYAHVDEDRPLEGAFVERLNEVNTVLAPSIRANQNAALEWRAERRLAAKS